MALDYRLFRTIRQAVHGILLGGRVYLKEDMDADDDIVPVGTTLDVSGSELPGWGFFNGYTTDAVLVQPAASDEPDAIEHSETVTIDTDTFVAGRTKDILLTDGVANEYTVARGAYIRPVTVPTVSAGLQFIASDFVAAAMQPNPDVMLPGVIVGLKQRQDPSLSTDEIGFTFSFSIWYCDILRDDQDNTLALMEKAEDLAGLLYEDNWLGGTVLQSEILGITPWHQSLLAQRGMKFYKALEQEIGWAEISMWAKAVRVWGKHPALS